MDFSFNRSFLTKTIDEVLKLFETQATTSAMWASKRAIQKKTPGVYEVDAYLVLFVKINSPFHKEESMSQSVDAIQTKKLSCEESGMDHILQIVQL